MKDFFNGDRWLLFVRDGAVRANAIFLLSLSIISLVIAFNLNWVIGLIMVVFLAVGLYISLNQLYKLRDDTNTYLSDLTYQLERGQQEALLDMPLGMITMDDHEMVKWINPYMAKYFKLETVVGKPLSDIEKQIYFVDPDAEVWRLPVGQQQWVEILKALYRDCKVLVLDEPTAVLTPSESDNLCRAIGKITAQGKSVIFISHKLREVMEITDNVTVLRDGKVIGTIATKDATQLKLAEMMVGRAVEIERRPRAKVPADSEPVLVMKDVNVYDERGVHALKNFNLTVHAGEIVGVAGIDGNGQRELAECISGLIKPQSGTIEIKGKPVTGVISDPSFLGFIPEDRHKTGLVLDFTVAENLIIKEYMKAPFAKKGILQYKEIGSHANEMIDKFHVKTSSKDVAVKTLSGGNQQKVVIARELNPEPILDIASQPTRGLDLGAVMGVHDVLMQERERGAAVLFISAELQEVMALSDRIIVLYSGENMGDLDGDTADQAVIGQMMLGKRI